MFFFLRACCRSPIISSRPTISGDMLSSTSTNDLNDSNIWTNPNGSTENISYLNKVTF